MFENAHAGQAVWAWLKITTCSGHKKGQTSFRTHNSCLSTIIQQIGRQSAAWGPTGGRQTLVHHSSNLRKVVQKQKEPKGEFEQKVTSLKRSFILSLLQKAFLFTASFFYCGCTLVPWQQHDQQLFLCALSCWAHQAQSGCICYVILDVLVLFCRFILTTARQYIF